MTSFRRFRFRFLLLVGVLAQSAAGQATAIADFPPNATLKETILAFGPHPQAAEMAAMARAWETARDGVFKVKNIGLGTVDGDDYCMLKIEHEVYRPPDTKRVGEMVIGYGSNPHEALANARSKAFRRIRENPLGRPNLRRSTTPGGNRSLMPMPEEEERDYTVQSLRFWGRDGEWRCYFKFEYLEMR